MKSFDDSLKEEVSNSVKDFEAMSFGGIHIPMELLDQPITLAEVTESYSQGH